MRPLAKTKTARRGRPAGKFTQHRRLDKLRDVLEASPQGLSLHELAVLLQVTERSVRRYLGELDHLTDVESVATVPGGAHRWRIKPSERARAVPLRRAQAYALLATRKVFEPLKGSALYDELDFAHRQLHQLATRPGRTQGKQGKGEIPGDLRLDERLLYLPPAHANYTHRGEELDDVFRAVAGLHVLRFRYRDAAASSAAASPAGAERSELLATHPYAMLVQGGSIHLVARELRGGEVECFLFERMADVESSDSERFALPPAAELRLDDYVHGEFGVGRARSRVRVVVEFEARVAALVRARKVHPSQKISSAPDGRLRLTLHVGDVALPGVLRWVLGFAEGARVIEPSELAHQVATRLTRAAARYRD